MLGRKLVLVEFNSLGIECTQGSTGFCRAIAAVKKSWSAFCMWQCVVIRHKAGNGRRIVQQAQQLIFSDGRLVRQSVSVSCHWTYLPEDIR